MLFLFKKTLKKPIGCPGNAIHIFTSPLVLYLLLHSSSENNQLDLVIIKHKVYNSNNAY